MNPLERAALGWLQRRCTHRGGNVVADILQRDYLPTVVAWCRTCGATWIHRDGEWSEPGSRSPFTLPAPDMEPR